jgi:putative SOS response-associated peptidase YedK
MFRTAFRRRRCLIPADGFYEWQQSASGASASSRAKKPAYFIHRPDGGLFAFAGLWDTWAQPGEPSLGADRLTIESCTIVTTAANPPLSELHERTPVVLAPGDYNIWLDSKVEDPATLKHLLAPCGADELLAEPVGTHVNRVANDDPQCVEVQRSLF